MEVPGRGPPERTTPRHLEQRVPGLHTLDRVLDPGTVVVDHMVHPSPGPGGGHRLCVLANDLWCVHGAALGHNLVISPLTMKLNIINHFKLGMINNNQLNGMACNA